MARKPNYSFEKNVRAKAKAAKREAKRQAKLAAKAGNGVSSTQNAPESDNSTADSGPHGDSPLTS